jgi:imidazolonepropionase-like amidohydrolase
MPTNPIVRNITVVAALAVLGQVTTSSQTPTLILDNIRIVDGSGAPPIERGRIVIEGSRIVRVGTADAVPIRSGEETIDLGGATAIPGLIDLHFHIENDPKLALRQLSHGVTAFRDPGQWDEKFAELRAMVGAAKLSGPRIFTTGPHIDGERPAYPADSVVARDAEEARRLAERAVRQGATALKIYFRLPFASAKAVIQVCEARGIPCTAHLEVLDAAELFAEGLHGVEHITSLGMSLVPKMKAEAYRQAVLADNDARRDGRYRLFAELDLEGREAQALYATLRSKKPWIDPTLAVFERRADRPPADTKREMVPVLAAGFAKMKALTHRAAREGARIVVGGHTSVPFAGRGEAPWREMELLVESGFTPLEAITAATATAASFLYESDEIGRLREGLQADLVILRGDPTRDIAAIRSVDRVMVAGRWIDVGVYRKY